MTESVESSAMELHDMLKVYYSRLFPLDEYYKWLKYGNEATFRCREFSFTLQNDIYIRYQSFRDQNHLLKELLRVVPVKIDFGAVYNQSPSSRESGRLKPVERELVFDIDLTDYDDIRTCCSSANVCLKCWKYMSLAVKILDSALREDFGFKNILWVFSGRRGIHAWVCDPFARTFDDSQRMAVGEYLQVISGGSYTSKKVSLPKIHHSIARALDIIKPVFVTMCVEEQNMLGSEEGIEKFVNILPDDESKEEMKTLFGRYNTSLDRWQAFVAYANDQIKSNKKWRYNRNIIEEVILQYSYPRLDINVTKSMNHLLKSPFSIHPKTGKVSIPFNPKAVDKFDPLQTPTITMVLKEIDIYDAKVEALEGNVDHARRIKDYKKTSMNKAIHVFQEFLRGLEHSDKIETNDAMDCQEI